MILAAQRDAELAHVMDQATMVVPESSVIAWAGRWMNTPLEFTPGIDLMMALSQLAAEEGCSVYLLGSAPGVAESAAKTLKTLYPGLEVAGMQHGFFKDEAEVIRHIR